jgi:hypothetical protein
MERQPAMLTSSHFSLETAVCSGAHGAALMAWHLYGGDLHHCLLPAVACGTQMSSKASAGLRLLGCYLRHKQK